MTDEECRELVELAADLQLRASRLPLDSQWRGWMLRRSETIRHAAGLRGPTALRVIRGAYHAAAVAAQDRAAGGEFLVGGMAALLVLFGS